MVKIEPSPSLLLTEILPLIFSISYLLRQSPRPVPPNCLDMAGFPYLKAMNSSSSSSSLIPAPLSITSILNIPLDSRLYKHTVFVSGAVMNLCGGGLASGSCDIV